MGGYLDRPPLESAARACFSKLLIRRERCVLIELTSSHIALGGAAPVDLLRTVPQLTFPDSFFHRLVIGKPVPSGKASAQRESQCPESQRPWRKGNFLRKTSRCWGV